MDINLYRWNETDPETQARIMRRAQADIDAVCKIVQPIIEDVRVHGDEALRRYAKKFEGAEIENIKATPEEFARAEENLDDDLKAAIKRCAANVDKFHVEQFRRVEDRWMVEIEPGVWAGEQVSAIDSVGLYVPRGKGAFPSALYMLALPAVIAGVKTIAVVTPPTADGSIDDATLYTAKLCGIEDVYKCGGAQGIAALGYGTQSVPKVKKVLGPGSPYVAAAKRILSDIMDPGMPAGPSESIVLADGSANFDNTILDVLNEAEHGKDSGALLVTHDAALAKYVQENMPAVINSLPEKHRDICAHVMAGSEDSYGGIILTESLEASIAFSNAYAPEHLHLKIKDGENYLDQLTHAGEILLGEYTPSSLGNYGIGVNHVLPTGGNAHTYSCTSVWDFLKRTSISRCDKQGFESLKDAVCTMTDYEDFPAHGEVLRRRKV
ncbi:MAG: histidinol dehydrogenase [Alphaproteobacteria bacterium]|nr:MAG: histidinol dehydrogenase [Alphaproteobacteria bacterium]